MKVFRDGNGWCVTEDDFQNVQESPCEFVPCDSLVGRFIEQHAGETTYLGFGEYGVVVSNLDGTTVTSLVE